MNRHSSASHLKTFQYERGDSDKKGPSGRYKGPRDHLYRRICKCGELLKKIPQKNNPKKMRWERKCKECIRKSNTDRVRRYRDKKKDIESPPRHIKKVYI